MTTSAIEPIRIDYGEADRQHGDLWLPGPPGDGGPHPVVVLIHGGFWRNRYRLDLMEPLAADLSGRGFAAWNIEYRSVGDDGGGCPGTLLDVAAGIDHLGSASTDHALDPQRVAVVGHSAGGHLALWSASRHLLDVDDPGGRPVVVPQMAVSQAGVVDLTAAARDRLGDGATQAFLGGEPNEVPDAYRIAQPVVDRRVARFVHGSDDDTVPTSQSTDNARGSAVAIIDGADHFDVIDPSHDSWRVVVDWLSAL